MARFAPRAAQVALRWVLDQQGITSVIVGATSAEQMRNNLGCTGWTLPDDVLTKLKEVSALPPRYPHSMESTMHQRCANAARMPTFE